MSGKMIGIILGIIVVVVGLAAVGLYNGLVRSDENVNNAWAQVETVLQRRYDLIPNLVNTVKGYAQHEKGLFEEIARLRSQWGEARNAESKVAVANQMEGMLGRLIAVAENYPELKANQNFLALQDELAGTENRIAVERRRYNDAVRAYNVSVRTLPSSLFAGLFGFQPKTAYFQADKAAQAAPKVQFP